MSTAVINVRRARPDVYIGRPSKWGNPFVIGRDGDRDEVIRRYAAQLAQDVRDGKVALTDLIGLHGKTLGCYCAPQRCHGDVLACAADATHEAVGLLGATGDLSVLRSIVAASIRDHFLTGVVA